MTVVTIADDQRKVWDQFVTTNAHDGGLLQSWEWGNFQHSLGNKIIRLAALDKQSTIRATALVIKHELHFEYNYLYCPRGPILADGGASAVAEILQAIRDIGHQDKSFMIRLDPAWQEQQQELLKKNELRPSDYQTQPKCNMVIDLTPDEAALTAAMKQKTRYNINLAQRKGVTISVSDQPSEAELFWQLVKQTSQRDKFKPHGKEHYVKMLELFGTARMLKLYLATFEGKTLAAALVSFFGDYATYLHGASASAYREVMAPYLLHWQIMQDAKKLGFHYYDLGGVNAKSYHNENWLGITRFKTGFGSVAPREYVGAYEQVLNPVVYSAYKFIKQIRG